MTPDDICKDYVDSDVKIRVTEIEDAVLIEGTREGLEFLSKLLSAQAIATDDSFSISPFGAGMAWFMPESTRGIYIRRISELNDK